MEFTTRSFTARDAAAVEGWRYDPPYDFYDLDADPDDRAEFLDPSQWVRYVAVDAGGEFAGFATFAGDDVVEVGLGLRPDLTGDGLGAAFLRICLEYGRAAYAPEAFELAVAAFNERAIRVYTRVGFEETCRYEHETNGGTFEFVRMRRDA